MTSALIGLALAAPAVGANGTFERTWGRNVDSIAPGTGFEICFVAANCKAADASTGLGGEMNGPSGVAVDSAGSVYVADVFPRRIQKFDSAGNFLRAWGRDVVLSGEHETATDGFEICVNPAGSDPDDVCKGAAASTGLGGEMTNPAGVATDSAGNVFVADGPGHRIQEFDSSGNFLRAWGRNVDSTTAETGFETCTVAANCKSADASTGLGGEMTNPEGVATDSAGNVYVGDFNNNRIQKFDSAGNFLRAWGRDVVLSGEHETAADGFEICVNPAGSDPDDVCKGAAASTGLGGEMSLPSALATDGAANVYLTDTTNQRIQVFDSSGNFLRAWGKDVVLSGEHETATDGFEICVNPAGSDPADVCKSGVSAPDAGAMITPRGVATDSGGNVYLSDQGNNRIQKFDSAGNFLRAWGRNVDSMTAETGFEICTVAANCKAADASTGLGGEMNGPSGVAADSAGSVYLADFVNDRIQKFADPVPSSGAPAAPSNAFTIGKLKGKTLKLNVSSAGEVKITDAAARANGSGASAAAKRRRLKPSSATGGPGTIQVKLKLTKAAKRKLRERGKVKVNARITFTPNGGTANSQTAKLNVKK